MIFFQTPKCLIRFHGPLEPAGFLEELEEWKASLFELRDESCESRHTPCEALSLLQLGQGLHAINCFHLLWVHLDATTQHEEA
jgi:hypothetical protein